MGPELVDNMKRQAERFGAYFMDGSVLEAELSQRPFRLNIEGHWVETRTLIIASGASARWIGLPSEQALIGHGVSSCATCDGFFYKGKKIMVIGGGDSAMEEANFLTRFGSEVALVHRNDNFRASKIMLDRAIANPKIKFQTSTVVEEVHDVSKNTVTGVRLRNLQSGQVWDQEVDGFSWPSATSRTPKFSVGRLRRTPMGISCPRAGLEPASKASSMPETCRIECTGKPSPRRERVAWPPSKWKKCWKQRGTET